MPWLIQLIALTVLAMLAGCIILSFAGG